MSASRPGVDCSAAFAGVVRPPAVVAAADVVIAAPSLAPVLVIAASDGTTEVTPTSGCDNSHLVVGFRDDSS